MEKYKRIAASLEREIENGTTAQLDSIRKLAQTYSCSKSTVIKALELLVERHLVYAVPKSGYYVVQKTEAPKAPPTTAIDFINTSPHWAHYPYDDFKLCLNKAVDTYKTALFTYGTPQGLPDLIDEARQLLTHYQVFCKPEAIVVVSGVQQALSLLCQMPFPGAPKTALIENPGYHLLIEMLDVMKVPVATIERTESGIDFNRLEALFQTGTIKFFYCMPRIHNPLGVSYTREQKKKLVALAAQYGVYIVEDDYLADFETERTVDPLHYYDTEQRVIYLKSFSKIMFPGLRVGFAVLPEALRETFVQHKHFNDIDSSMFSQAALTLYIQNGMFQRHIKKLQDQYTAKTAALENAFVATGARHLLPNTPLKGAKTVMTLPETVTATALVQALKRREVLVEDLTRNCYPPIQNKHRIKLDVFNTAPSRITEGVERIVETLESLL
ncbi:aminotransferase-like domain-containing protein [Fusibacter sp. JL298sf-3]